MHNPFELQRKRVKTGQTERLVGVLIAAALFVAMTYGLSSDPNAMAKCEQNFSRVTCIYNLR